MEDLCAPHHIPVVLIASDVSGRERILYDSLGENKQDRLVEAVLDSCALPFFFRTATSNPQSLILDGGLCDSLPIDVLTGGAAIYGDIVAVCFRESPGTTPKTAVGLGLALLDTAMSASVAKAKALGNTTLIELEPYGVTTFDFERAQRILGGQEDAPYDNALQRALETVEELCASAGRVLSANRWESADPATMDQLWTLYKAQQNHG